MESKIKISASHQNIEYDEWVEFAVDKKYCPDFNEKCRESNREKYNMRCFLCNRLEEDNIDKNGKIRKLSVHHVDMNKQQGCDGYKWKLVPLCMLCHTSAHNKIIESHIEYILEKIEEGYEY